MRKLLYRISDHLPARYIDHDGQAYMERFYVATIGNVRVYLHRFVASDPDGLHTHPFRWSWSFILAGWYYEDRPMNRRIRRFFNFIGPDDLRRVVLPDDGRDCWTLFFHTPRRQSWGTLRRVDGKVLAADEPGVLQSAQYDYVVQSEPEDPAFSTWYKTAPKGRELRKTRRQIPLGLSAAGAARQQ